MGYMPIWLNCGNRKAGYSLVELIIAISLIAIVSVVGLEFCAQYLHIAMQLPLKIKAMNYAQQEMENLYMDGTWDSGSDILETGIKRAWNVNSSPNTNDYTLISVNAQS